jgi:hypothetical protein
VRRPSVLLVLAALGLGAACGAGATREGAAPAALAAREGVAPALDAAAGPRQPPDDAAIVHLLDRATFGARRRDVDRVRAIGVQAWIDEQLAPERLDDREVDEILRGLPTLSATIPDLLRDYPRPAAGERRPGPGASSGGQMRDSLPADQGPGRILAELQAARLVRAVASARQLQEVMVDVWFNHLNVSAQKAQVRWYVGAYERDAMRPHALGRFRELLRASARHPAMLFYLDTWVSVRAGYVIPAGPNQGRTAGLNENYARELMELHTLGVDGGYTQADVRDVARAFTGWSIDRPRSQGRFVFRRAAHDRGEKVVLGQRLPAGGGEEDGERVIAILTRHPATARHVAARLARRFVADDPPPALVARVAAVYAETDGDIRAMLRAIFAAPEFWGEQARRAKIKKPLELVASGARALGAAVEARGGLALARAAGRIGERLYQAEAPTGHPDRAEPWVNPGALLARMNFALALAHNRLPGVRVDLAAVAGSDRRRPEVVLERLLGELLLGGVAPETRAVLTSQLLEPQIIRRTADDRDPADTDVETLTALVLGSPEFQRR